MLLIVDKLLAATESGFFLLDRCMSGGLRPMVSVLPLSSKGTIRFNDGACDVNGRFFAGTLALEDGDCAQAGIVYCAEAGITRVVRGAKWVGCSNGIGWSSDWSTV